ncbi:MAG TPA: DUF6186 family protein [Actinomycetota bacterium]
MSSHAVTVAGFLLIFLAGLALEWRARRPSSRIPTIDALLRRAMYTRSGRVGVIAAWAWLGLHFFAR